MAKSDIIARAKQPSAQLSSEEYTKEFRSYAGRERVVLRKRRTKLKVDQFRIIAQASIFPHHLLWNPWLTLDVSSGFVQVGQGGYGSVYLARRVDTGQVCALKKMKKATLAKMDEVGKRSGASNF